MRYLIGIDNGGTFSKAAVFTEDGEQLSAASVPSVTFAPKPGYTERDMDELWQVNAQFTGNFCCNNFQPPDCKAWAEIQNRRDTQFFTNRFQIGPGKFSSFRGHHAYIFQPAGRTACC